MVSEGERARAAAAWGAWGGAVGRQHGCELQWCVGGLLQAAAARVCGGMWAWVGPVQKPCCGLSPAMGTAAAPGHALPLQVSDLLRDHERIQMLYTPTASYRCGGVGSAARNRRAASPAGRARPTQRSLFACVEPSPNTYHHLLPHLTPSCPPALPPHTPPPCPPAGAPSRSTTAPPSRRWWATCAPRACWPAPPRPATAPSARRRRPKCGPAPR